MLKKRIKTKDFIKKGVLAISVAGLAMTTIQTVYGQTSENGLVNIKNDVFSNNEAIIKFSTELTQAQMTFIQTKLDATVTKLMPQTYLISSAKFSYEDVQAFFGNNQTAIPYVHIERNSEVKILPTNLIPSINVKKDVIAKSRNEAIIKFKKNLTKRQMTFIQTELDATVTKSTSKTYLISSAKFSYEDMVSFFGKHSKKMPHVSMKKRNGVVKKS